MMPGKLGRPSFKRTTSITGIAFNLGDTEEAPPHPAPTEMIGGGEYQLHNMLLSPRYFRKSSSSATVETADFLRSCGLCRRRLAPGRDIYMYRGDTAFCSLECREQQMKQDERKEKSAAATAANNGESHHSQIAATGKSGAAVAA